MQPLFENGHQDVHRDGDPNLCLHGVLGAAVKGFDAQVLLDPFEEQLDSPSRLVKPGDAQRRKREIVCQKRQPSFGLGVEVANAPQRVGVVPGGSDPGEGDSLIAPQSGGPIDGVGVSPLKLEIVLGTGDIEGRSSRQDQEPSKVYVASIHNVEGTRLGQEGVEDVDVVNPSRSHADKGGNAAAQVQKGVQFDRRFVLAKASPGKQRQAQIDGGGIQGVDGLLQLDAERIVDVQMAGGANQSLSEVGIDAPVALLVGGGQSAPRRPTVKAHVVKLARHRAQTGFDIAKTFAVGQLSEGHAQELIPTGEAFDVVVAVIAIHANLKLVARDIVHELSQNGSCRVHRLPPGMSRRE